MLFRVPRSRAPFRTVGLCGALSVAALLAAPAARATPARAPVTAPVRTVGVLPLDPVRLPGDALLLLQADLQARLEARGVETPIPQEQMLSHLQAVRALGLSCDRESVECIVRIGALAGLQQVVRGVAERRRAVSTGYEALLQLWLHDASDGHVIGYVYAFLPGDNDARTAAIDDAWARLFDPEHHGGTLHIASEVNGAQVTIDSLALPDTPLPFPLTGLLPGEHVLEIKKEGHESLLTRPTIVAGEEVEVYALLAPEAPEPLVPVIEAPPALSFGRLPEILMFTGVSLIVVSGGAIAWGMWENLQRNAAGQELAHYEALYRIGAIDLTDGSAAARVARLQDRNSDDAGPLLAFAVGGVGVFFGTLLTTGSGTLVALGAE